MYIYILYHCWIIFRLSKENHKEIIFQNQKEDFSLMEEAEKAAVIGDIIGFLIFPGHRMIITAYNEDGSVIRSWTLTYPQFGWETRRYTHAWESDGFYLVVPWFHYYTHYCEPANETHSFKDPARNWCNTYGSIQHLKVHQRVWHWGPYPFPPPNEAYILWDDFSSAQPNNPQQP